MKYTLWIAVLVLGMIVQGCGSEKSESRPDNKLFWIGEWTMHANNIEKARISTVGMTFQTNGIYQDGSFNKGKFYPFSNNTTWDLNGGKLLIIKGIHTNTAEVFNLTNREVRLEFPDHKMFMVKIIKKEK